MLGGGFKVICKLPYKDFFCVSIISNGFKHIIVFHLINELLWDHFKPLLTILLVNMNFSNNELYFYSTYLSLLIS